MLATGSLVEDSTDANYFEDPDGGTIENWDAFVLTRGSDTLPQHLDYDKFTANPGKGINSNARGIPNGAPWNMYFTGSDMVQQAQGFCLQHNMKIDPYGHTLGSDYYIDESAPTAATEGILCGAVDCALNVCWLVTHANLQTGEAKGTTGLDVVIGRTVYTLSGTDIVPTASAAPAPTPAPPPVYSDCNTANLAGSLVGTTSTCAGSVSHGSACSSFSKAGFTCSGTVTCNDGTLVGDASCTETQLACTVSLDAMDATVEELPPGARLESSCTGSKQAGEKCEVVSQLYDCGTPTCDGSTGDFVPPKFDCQDKAGDDVAAAKTAQTNALSDFQATGLAALDDETKRKQVLNSFDSIVDTMGATVAAEPDVDLGNTLKNLITGVSASAARKTRKATLKILQHKLKLKGAAKSFKVADSAQLAGDHHQKVRRQRQTRQGVL